jgi:tRNA (guanine26-N2/guanine27-N2)-dimethyltransferase
MLTLLGNEADCPVGYYVVDHMCDALTLPVPSVKKVVEALKLDGFHAVQTHFTSRGVRSDVPARRLVKILRSLAGVGRAD